MRTLLWLCLTAALLVAGLGSASAELVTLAGVVLGPDDKPLAEAEVWLLQTRPDRASSQTTTVATVRSDATGRFSFAPTEAPGERYARFVIVALKPPLAAGRTYVPLPGDPQRYWPDGSTAPTTPGDLKVTCAEAEAVSGQITNDAGAAVAATIVEGRTVSPELAERLSARTDATGKFVITWLAKEAAPYVTAKTEGYGELVLRRRSPQDRGPFDIRLQRPARLTLQFTCPRHPEAIATLKGGCSVHTDRIACLRPVTPDAAGVAVVSDLQPGSLSLWFSTPVTSPWQVGPREAMPLKAGDDVRLEIPIRQAFPVTGTVVDADGGAPIPGIRVMPGQTALSPSELPVTDQAGNYSFYALPGSCTVQVTDLPPEFIRRGRYAVEVNVTEQGAKAEPIRLQRGLTLEGVAVDEKGQPVPNARIQCQDVYVNGGNPVLSDTQGHFILKGLSTEGVSVWAQTDTLVVPEVSLKGADMTKPLHVDRCGRVAARRAPGSSPDGRAAGDGLEPGLRRAELVVGPTDTNDNGAGGLRRRLVFV